MGDVSTSDRTKCRISYERFDEALRTLGVRNPNSVTARYPLEDIEAAYEAHLDVLTLERSYTEQGDAEAQLAICEKYKLFSEAYEDIREFIEFQKGQHAKHYDFE